MDMSTIALLLLAPILVWRIYTRVKGAMARQRSVMQKHYTGVLAFTIVILVAAAQLVDLPASLGWLGVGTGLGVAWGSWGLKQTRFEKRPDGYFFTPYARLGMVVAMQFVAAVMYVGFEIYANQGTGLPTPRVTEYIFFLPSLGLMAGYFGMYSVGLLRWRLKLRKEIGGMDTPA